MSSDNQIDKKQGAIKSSEIFTDRSLEIIKNLQGDTALKTLEGLMKPVSDALRFNNFLLHSDGQIFWEDDTFTTKIKFDSDGKDNNIKLRLMMMDESATAQTVDVIIPGTTGANSVSAFNEIELSNNELIYLELSRDLLLSAVPPAPGQPAELILENGIDGGSVVTGKRVLKASMTESSGMPRMVADMNAVDQTNSQTVNIPLASRFDWSDGIDTYRDIWWIPHGIRWPANSRSVVGAVVVSGFDALPDFFVRNQLELQQALTTLDQRGGIITPIANFTVTAVISITKGIKILGKSGADGNAFSTGTVTFAPGGSFNFAESAGIENVAIEMAAGFGSAGAESAIKLSGEHSYIKDCSISVLDVGSIDATCVEVNSNLTRIDGCYFISTIGSAIGINQTLATSTNNLWQFNRFSGITETQYSDLGRIAGVRSDYGMVPLGSIISWSAFSYTDANNAGSLGVPGITNATDLGNYLGDGWIVCDGSELPDGSPLKRGSNVYAPQINDDRFLRGSTTPGALGGSSTTSLITANLPAHSHTMNHGHGDNFSVSGDVAPRSHRHYMAHVHEWAQTTGLITYTRDEPSQADAEEKDILDRPSHPINGLVGRDGGNRLNWGGADDVHYTAGAQRSYATINYTDYLGGSGASIGLAGSVTSYSGSTGNTGSGTAFSNEPQYFSTIFIMRVK